MALIHVRNSPKEPWRAVDVEDVKSISSAKTIDARGCTGLTELKADSADYIDARGCTGLTELKADSASLLSLIDSPRELITDLRPWREEMAIAEDIFKAANPQIGDWCAWIHHEVQFEKLNEPWKNRFAYIASEKSEDERAWRFRMIRPVAPTAVKDAIAALKTK